MLAQSVYRNVPRTGETNPGVPTFITREDRSVPCSRPSGESFYGYSRVSQKNTKKHQKFNAVLQTVCGAPLSHHPKTRAPSNRGVVEEWELRATATHGDRGGWLSPQKVVLYNGVFGSDYGKKRRKKVALGVFCNVFLEILGVKLIKIWRNILE